MTLLLLNGGCPQPTIINETKTLQYFNHGRLMNINIGLWYPAEKPAAKSGLIIFSHGLGGSPKTYQTLIDCLVERGYIIVAPYHNDYLTTLNPLLPLRLNFRQLLTIFEDILDNLRQINGYENISLNELLDQIVDQCVAGLINNEAVVEVFSDAFAYRSQELGLAIDLAIAFDRDETSRLYGIIDENKIAVAGHSMGGDTILRKVIAGNPAYDPRIKAAVLMSPLSAWSKVADIAVPTRWITGTLDDPRLYPAIYQAFALSPGPSSLIDFYDVGHLTFSDAACALHQLVAWLWPGLAISDKSFTADAESLATDAESFAAGASSPEVGEKLFRPIDFAATRNWQEKTEMINAASADFFGFWLNGASSENNWLMTYQDWIFYFAEK